MAPLLCTPPAALPALPCSLTLSSISLWTGQGMACVGRTKECTIVPSNHYGPIPGIPVGTMWRFRVQVLVNIWSLAAGVVFQKPLRRRGPPFQQVAWLEFKPAPPVLWPSFRGEVLITGVIHSEGKSGPWL